MPTPHSAPAQVYVPSVRGAAPRHPQPRPRRAPWRLLLVSWSCLTLAACLTDPQPDIPQDAVVTYETVRLEYAGEPETETSGAPLEAERFQTLSAPLVGQRSELRTLAITAIVGTNSLLFGTLTSVDILTRIRPSEAHDDQWIWQGDNAQTGLYNRFVLSRDAEPGRAGGPRYTYLLAKRTSDEADDALVPVFTGAFEPLQSAALGERVRTGEGIIRYDFDALHQFDPDSATGDAAIAFRSAGRVRQVRVFLREVLGKNDVNPLTAAYEYVQLPNRGGAFRFATRADFLKDGEPFEDLAVHLVWTPDGAGRSFSVVSGGSLPFDEAAVHECWDTTGTSVYIGTEPEITEVVGGDEAACHPELQGLLLDRPVAVGPGAGDPEVPSAHADEQ